MTPALLLLLGLGSTLGAPSTTVFSGARSELRLRGGPALEAQGGKPPATDVDSTGTLGVAFDWRRTQLSLTYAPRFVLNDIGGPQSTRDFFQGLDVLLANQSRSYVLTLSQHVDYGYRSFNTLARADIDPTTSRPIATPALAQNSVLYASSITQVGVRMPLSRRSDLGVTATYGFAGGVNEESRRTVPMLVGPRFLAVYNYAATRRDTFGLSLAGIWLRSLGTTQIGTINTGAVTFGQRWDRTWQKELRMSLSVGESLLVDSDRRMRVLPQGFASVTRGFAGGREHGRFDLSLGAGTSIDADPLTGTARPSARATGQIAWTAYPYRTYLIGGVVKTLASTGGVGGDNATTVYTGDLGGSYNLTRTLLLESGVRVAEQKVHSPTTLAAAAAASGLSYAVFAAIAWRPQPLRF